ncbi:DUF4468 domain-containing protein [Hymenobacter caeli]|uniref:DUF4468 domain-containing protein n=1 Tax=Hymenobacter caeli TaxID=2735894 RepID=A0ABX2FM87_9BACT|nr:DUF4468 domain-containing protein [Hymenobacter caeli]NRT18052.1 hypothetical protein [Hymenobacter caeli]
MKYAFVLLLLIGGCPRAGRAQALLPDTLRYQQVVPVPGRSAADLYARAREWAVLTFDDAHQAVQLDDSTRHLLLGSGYTQLQVRRPNGKPGPSALLWCRFRVEARAGRYRVELSGFGEPYSFSSPSDSRLSPGELNLWVRSGYATQALSERHYRLSRGFAGIWYPNSSYPSLELEKRVRAALDEAAQALLAGLLQIETAPPATW